MTLFFVWSGEHAKIHDSGMNGFGPWEATLFGGQSFGVFHQVGHIHTHVSRTHAKIAALPGPNGSLNQEQATAILPAFPNAVVGMPMRDILGTIYAATGVEAFNPNNY